MEEKEMGARSMMKSSTLFLGLAVSAVACGRTHGLGLRALCGSGNGRRRAHVHDRRGKQGRSGRRHGHVFLRGSQLLERGQGRGLDLAQTGPALSLKRKVLHV